MRILLVEDEQKIAANLEALLTTLGYGVDCVTDMATGYMKLADTNYDLVIVDRGLPDGDGMALVKTIRSENNPALILLLTARGQADDIVEGLNSGADDYLVKPFRFSELDARIRALLRRTSPLTVPPVLSVGDIAIDTNSRTVTRQGKHIPLAPKEYALFEYLVRNKGIAMERIDLLEHVWNERTDEFSQTVDVHIRYLRKKIDDPYRKKVIHTVKGKGYMVCDD